MTTHPFLLASGIAALAAFTGCSPSKQNADTSYAAGASAAAAPVGAPAAAPGTDTTAGAAAMPTAGGLKTANVAGIGDYLTDATGRAVYMFEKDGKNSSACTGDCAKSWPPVSASAASSGAAGVNAAMLGTIQRADGVSQATYNGMPLYYYEDDEHAGDIKGQDKEEFGAEWYLVAPAGKKAEGKANN
jgi:predicted lipoprotein with Yx(FWY)xxD motif